jgi:hypothetical protein
MVNAKNITLAALATTVVVAVVGVEVYNSGTYKTQVAWHGTGIVSGETYAESVQACGDMNTSSKDNGLNACIENNKRTEMKMEMESGVVVAMINDDVSVFTRTATGLVHVSDGSAADLRILGEMEGASDEQDEVMSKLDLQKEGNVLNFGNDVKIVLDEIATNPQPLDFSEERAASKRSLLSSRQGRALWGKAGKAAKKAYKYWKKVKKKYKCLKRIVQIWIAVHWCIFSFFTTAFSGGTLVLFQIWHCGKLLYHIWMATRECSGEQSVPNPPTPSDGPSNVPRATSSD